MTMTPELLRKAWGCTAEIAERFAEPLSAACAFYGIDTPARLAMFLAQLGHESGGGRYTSEIWGPTPAQVRYEGRADLGNTQLGDGRRFAGHGLIQTTGRFNHAKVRDRLRERFPHLDVPDFEADPERLAEPQWACLSAADYWDMKGLNALADAGDFIAITKKINGGVNGLADRQARLKRSTAAVVKQDDIAAAPIQETATPLSQEATMPFPVLPLILGLANTLIGAFEPLAREKITKEMSRHTDNPEVQSQIATGVIESVKVLTGKEDPVEAVIAARADPQIMAQVQADTLADLERMAPILDKVAQWERETAERHEASMDSAAKRAAGESWDMAKVLVGGMFALLGLLIVFVCGIAATQAWKGEIKPEVWAQVAGLIGFATGVATTIYAYRFGTSRSSGAKDLVIGELSKRPR
jgi:putative chitinase